MNYLLIPFLLLMSALEASKAAPSANAAAAASASAAAQNPATNVKAGAAAAAATAPSLSGYDFGSGFVLPVYPSKDGKTKYVLLGREHGGSDKGTWSAFGGKRDKGEKHPKQTAAREFAEETEFYVFGNKSAAEKYIDLDKGHTDYIIARKGMVMYITNFKHHDMYHLIHKFSKHAKAHHEMDALARVKYEDLQKAIASVKAKQVSGKWRNDPITVTAEVVYPAHNKDGYIYKQEQITLRPLMGQLKYLFLGKPYTAGKSPKIHFYK